MSPKKLKGTIPTDTQTPAPRRPIREPQGRNWERLLENAKDRAEVLSIIKEIKESGDKKAIPALIDEHKKWSDGSPDDEIDIVEEVTAAINHIGLEECHLASLEKELGSGDFAVRKAALKCLGDLNDDRVVPILIKAMDDPVMAVRQCVSQAIWAQTDLYHRCKDFVCVVPKLIALAESIADSVLSSRRSWACDDRIEPIHVLGDIGDKRAIAPLKSILGRMARVESYDGGLICGEICDVLRHFDVSEKEMENIFLAGCKEGIGSFLRSPLDHANYSLVQKPDAKRIVFEKASVLSQLPDSQAWITINDPQAAKDALLALRKKLPAKMGSVDHVLSASLGVKVGQLEEHHFRYYADEIIDSIVQVAVNTKLKDDPEFQEIVSRFRYASDVKLRYARRCEADLSLGDKCGDCTAKGSVNFSNSLTWFSNPAYNILIMQRNGRFIGKVNIALSSMDGEDAIIVDALEFNPQAKKGNPYYEDGEECLQEALAFLRDLSSKEKRALIAVTISNSSGAIDTLRKFGKPLYDWNDPETDTLEQTLAMFSRDIPLRLKLVSSKTDIERILNSQGYTGEIKVFYQILDSVEAKPFEKPPEDLVDKRLPILEREVVNPAQIADESIGKAMRSRDFALASALILADASRADKVKSIFGIPKGIGISPSFLEKKLGAIYKTQAVGAGASDLEFIVDGSRFVRL